MAKFQIYGLEAEELYVKGGKTLEEISKFLGISIKTLSCWKKRGEWSEKRKTYLTSAQGTIGILETVLQEKIEELRGLPAEEINSKRIDGITKLVASIQKLKREDDLKAQTINVMGEFGRFVRAKSLKERELDLVTRLIQEFFEFIRES